MAYMASKVFYGWTCRAYLGSAACAVLTTGIDRRQWPWWGWLVKTLHVPSLGDENEASVCNDVCMSRERRPQRQRGGEIKSFLCSFREALQPARLGCLMWDLFLRGKLKREREGSEREKRGKRDKWLDVKAVNESILMQGAVCGCP